MTDLPSFDPSTDPAQLLSDIHAYVETVREALKARDMNLLEQTGAWVDAVCAQLATVTLPDTQKEALAVVIKALQEVQQEMIDLKSTSQEELLALSQRQKARHAYVSKDV